MKSIKFTSIVLLVLLCMNACVCTSASCFYRFYISVCSGEDVFISLFGACEELNIHLEPDSVMLKRTYISLATTHKVSLTNRGDIPLQYCWSAWPSQDEEDLSLLRYVFIHTQGHRQYRTVEKFGLCKIPLSSLCVHLHSVI